MAEEDENIQQALGAILAMAQAWHIFAAIIVVVVLVNILLFFRSKTRKPFLNPEAFQPLQLVEKTYITHNTVRLRFSLPAPDMRLGLPIGQHITFLAKGEDGKDIYRPYTPTSDDDLLGAVEFVIKVYPQGKMSQVIAKMQVNDYMQMKGPKGRFSYTPNMVPHLGAWGQTWCTLAAHRAHAMSQTTDLRADLSQMSTASGASQHLHQAHDSV